MNMKINLNPTDKIEQRHIGPSPAEINHMLEAIGVDTIDKLIRETIPASIRLDDPLTLPEPLTERSFLESFRKIATKNKINRTYIGLGYYDTITPAVIQRNIFENPGWYTSYTPYQAEIAQGRLEALINFQTMVTDLTGMDVANASLLDEGTAAAEAMSLLYAIRKGEKKRSNKILVDKAVFPQTLDILHTRSRPLEIELVITEITKESLEDPDIFALIFQYPDGNGKVESPEEMVHLAKEHNILTACIADLLSLTILTPPGDFGVDVVTGTTQRFGIPMGYGGPHAAYFATREEFKRQIPGRIIGVSVDAEGNPAYRMALQTREQHIRREKATSNICTAQVLLAVMAGMYGVYHGPLGLKNIALRIHGFAAALNKLILETGYEQENTVFFDTLKISVNENEKEQLKKITEEPGINLRYYETNHVGISIDETVTAEHINSLITIFARIKSKDLSKETINNIFSGVSLEIPGSLVRKSAFMEHPVFNSYHSEHEMLRYLKKLENKDLSLVHSMISLGSCTMKLNATTEMIPVSWPEIAGLHPFAPVNQAEGYYEIIKDLEKWLNKITGFTATSLQPNSGAQGEFSGLMVIRAYHESRGEGHRNITLIPSSAHGTNPASAVMAGTEVVIVSCDDEGNIDITDLNEKAEKHHDHLAALMVTYPSTHGVFEESIREICGIIHQHGGQVYMDGANMNAQVGLTNPAIIGADVCHLNLHKTFCIPHGGGGPGVGPICVAAHLEPFLPGNVLKKTGGSRAINAVSAAPWGSASILPISYAYIRMMGAAGLTEATRIAILNANYVKSQLEKDYKILYTGKNNRSAHELIVDCREFKKWDVEVEDIAKRLMDYGFHAPTVSFPVPGTMMIEPTESESLDEMDRFCKAMLFIRQEIKEIEEGLADKDNNVLKNAPHTQTMVLKDDWDKPYSREKAVFPVEFVKKNKFWPAVARVDNAYGDRNLFCNCVPVSSYQEPEPVNMP